MNEGTQSAVIQTVAGPYPVPPPIKPEKRLTTGQWGVIAFLFSEVAFFSTLIVAYTVFFGRDAEPGGMGGPKPLDVLSLSLVIATTICLLSSSVTAHLAEKALHHGRRAAFHQLWAATILLGVIFLAGTAYEWYELIYRHQLTISRNLFGTTFYTLVGFHGLHVFGGVFVMSIILGMSVRGQLGAKTQGSVQLVSWYWHFVDGVWIVVFIVVYLLPRMV